MPGSPASKAGSNAIARIESQRVVFADSPSRLDLYRLPDFAVERQVRLRVHRNVAAERMLGLAERFARFSGTELLIAYQDYDDSLAFGSLSGTAQAEVVWLDAGRLSGLSGADLARHLLDRVEVLRGLTAAPILVFDLPVLDARATEVNEALRASAARIPAVYICPLSAVSLELGDGFASTRATDLIAVPVSAAGLMKLAQLFGLCWLPAALGARVRAVAVDLDNTLYDGVLAEDGADGIVVTPAHRAVQERLRDLHERGVFVAVLSRNEPEDVEALFAARSDFPLRSSDVDAWEVGWAPKSDGLERLAHALRISPESFAFVDDNPGELMEVTAAHPGVMALHASDPDLVARALELAPGLFRFADSEADHLRTTDLAASNRREQLLTSASDPQAYLRALGVVLTYGVDRPAHLKRLAELSSKTNQFTTALARLDEVQLAQRMADTASRVVSISMSDRFAESGVIALLSARIRDDATVVVEDVCVSCRALGRRLEPIMLSIALTRIASELGAIELSLTKVIGPRNQPARDWLSSLEGRDADHDVVVSAPNDVDDAPVSIEWESE